MSEIKRVLFVGSKKLGLSVLKTMHEVSPGSVVGAVTLNDTEDSRSCLKDFEAWCDEHDLPLVVSNKADIVDRSVEKHKPDWCMVCGWYRILTPQTLARVPQGFAGIHASLLPAYRGSSPLVWTLIRGDKKAGISLFRFDQGVDDGPLYFQCECSVSEDDTIAELQERLERMLLAKLRDDYPLILEGRLSPVPQKLDGVSYCAPRRPEDGRIDWKQEATSIHNFVRAQTHPYPGAFALLGEKKIHIWKTEIAAEAHFGMPGQMIRKDDCSVYVGCAPGAAVRIMSASIDGIAANPAEILRSFSDRLT